MKNIEEQTRKAAENHYTEWNKYPSNGVKEDCMDDFIAGAEWERNRDKWISVDDEWPDPFQSVAFVIDHPGTPRHGMVYGGIFTGGNPNYDKPINEFSTPGFSTSASYWQPLPELPKKEVKP